MIALLGSLIGFLGAVFPEILKIFQDGRDKAHELKILEIQRLDKAQDRAERKEEIGAQADIAEMKAIYKTYNTGVRWVDALNGTVRPVLAYAFFLIYMAVKWMQFSMLPDTLLPWHMDALWGDEDKAIFAGIISFYFGQRSMQKAAGRVR